MRWLVKVCPIMGNGLDLPFRNPKKPFYRSLDRYEGVPIFLKKGVARDSQFLNKNSWLK